MVDYVAIKSSKQTVLVYQCMKLILSRILNMFKDINIEGGYAWILIFGIYPFLFINHTLSLFLTELIIFV